MASEAVVTFVIGKLGDLLIQEFQLLEEVHDQFEWIKTELRQMQCYLKDADSKPKGDVKAKGFVAQIRDVSYAAEDVIDNYILIKTVQKRRRGFEGRVQKYACIINELRTRHEVVKQIERIKLKIENISRSRVTYNIDEGKQEASSSTPNLQERRRSTALLEESEVVGLQDEIKTLSEQLVNGEERRCVISIVGMGGSGKTALAKKVYDNVKDGFDCHAFICLSQAYVMKDVVMSIIECVMRLSSPEKERLDEVGLKKKLRDYLDEADLKKMLRDYLKDKRYLVVVDDIWSIEAWDDLKLILPDTGQSKSRVMLTTRNTDVASHADSSNLHEMGLLNDNDGWKLFLKQIFRETNPSTACPSDLEKKGREILAKCGGLPQAIVVLGALLAGRDKTLNAWSKVLHSVTSSSDNKCLKILALSYQDLPHYLKPCFLYFGLFPKNYEIHVGRLFRLWIAEGFIQQGENETVELEDIAEDYLEELVRRNMIRVASKRSNGSIRTCRIHDSFHDLSISEARENNFFKIHKNEGGTLSFSTSVRRLALHRRYELKENHSTSTVRSILCFPDSRAFLLELLKVSGKLLRVVDANWAEFAWVTLTKEVGDFVHLRYLELRHSKISEPLYSVKKNQNKTVECLPSSIGNLSRLQTLRLSYGGNLPDTISNLEQLRHLKADGELPDGQPKLNTFKNLQTLRLRAGSWIEDGLAKLTNLRKLGISGDLRSHHKALSDSIENFFYLQSLKLREGGSIPQLSFTRDHLHLYKMYLDGSIQKLPDWPPKLAELTLQNSKLKQDAISALEKLENLKILRLYPKSYDSKEMICSPSGFPKLETLELNQLPIEKWIVKEKAMPSIKSVELIGMSDLKPLPKQFEVGVLKQKRFPKEERSGASETGIKPGQ